MNPDTAYFLNTNPETQQHFRIALHAACEEICENYANLPLAYQGDAPRDLKTRIQSLPVCPEHGTALTDVLAWVGRDILPHSIALGSPRTMAHLHCPPLIPALAAEVITSTTNASMDSWDQAPAATALELHLLNWLATEIGWIPPNGGGVMTSGGTQSNLMGLLLARDHWCSESLGHSVQTDGLPPEAQRGRIFCAQAAHFSVQQAAALLGLGHHAVIPIETDAQQCLSLPALHAAIEQCRRAGEHPFAIVATAGTTDYGSIDPLPELAACARQHGLWLHVDAAYAGALLLSATHRDKLTGLALADSITLDFHKLFYQPISASAFMLRNPKHWELLRLHADYLNPPEHEALGIDDLVTRSLQTTRRFDALKVWVSLQHLGRTGFAEIIDKTITLAQRAAQRIEAIPDLELALQPALNTVLFRYMCPTLSENALDQLNHQIRQKLMLSGQALLGQTRFNGRTHMKMTILNPNITMEDFESIFKQTLQFAAALRIEK